MDPENAPFHVPPHRRFRIGTFHSRGYLPHDDAAGRLQFVTFRLARAFLDGAVGRIDRRVVMETIAERVVAAHPNRFRLRTWVVMPDHVHLVVRTGAASLGSVVGGIKMGSARRLNALIGGSGRVWDREHFDRRLPTEEAASAAIAYVELNPVRKGLCANILAWRWSGVHARLGRVPPD
jgi:putative transposase